MPEFLRDISSSVSHGCRYGNPFIAVIPGLRQGAHPGMTLEAIPAT
jgi:hypothetical protein